MVPPHEKFSKNFTTCSSAQHSVRVCWNSTQRIYPFNPAAPNNGPAGLESPTGQSTDRTLTRVTWVA